MNQSTSTCIAWVLAPPGRGQACFGFAVTRRASEQDHERVYVAAPRNPNQPDLYLEVIMDPHGKAGSDDLLLLRLVL